MKFRRVLLPVLLLLAAPSAFAQNPQTGLPPFGSFAPGGFDAINLQNLNTNFSIRIAGSQGRGISLRLLASYNSLFWNEVTINGTTSWTPLADANGNPTWGWTRSPAGAMTHLTATAGSCKLNGSLIYYDKNYNYIYWDAAGTGHLFPLVDWYYNPCLRETFGTTSGYAGDDSGYYLSNYSTVYAPSGLKTSPGSQMEDTNGNLISSTVVNGSETDWTDTVGRALKVVSETSSIQYQFLDSAGTYQTVTMNLTTFNIKTNFGCSGVVEYTGTASLPTSIVLPNGQQYSLTYEATPGHSGYYTGRVQRVTLPTGGYYEYDYPTTGHDGINCPDSTITSVNRVINDGTQSATWQFARSSINGAAGTTTLTDPLTYQTVATFDSNGHETSRKSYGTGGTLLRTVNTTWTTVSAPPAPFSYSYPATRTTIMADTNQQSETATTFDGYGNLTQRVDYGWGSGAPGALIRTTTIAYLSGSPYTTLNILDRPTSIAVTNSAGTTLAQTNVSYDGYGTGGLTDAGSSVAQHDDTNYGTGYTTRGNPTEIQRLVTGSTYVTTTLTYDTAGQVTSVTDPRGNITYLSYADSYFNDTGQPPGGYTPPAPTDAYLTKVTLPITGSVTFGYYYGTGKRALATDQNNASTYWHFLDSLDRLTSVYLPAGGWTLATYASETQSDIYLGIGDASPSTGCSSCRHDEAVLDGLGRLLQSVLVNDPDNATTVATTYDADSRVYTVTNPYRGSATGQDTFLYDGLGRATSVTHADSTSASTYYGAAAGSNGGRSAQVCPTATYGLGYAVLSVDEAGFKRQAWVDSLGRTIEVDEPDSTGGLNVATCYAYDANDNLTQVVQDYGQTGSETRSYSYDGLSRLTSATTPEGGTVSYSYDADGNVISRLAPKPNQTNQSVTVTTTYAYDALNRLTSASYSDGSTPTVNYYYDQSSYNGLSITNGIGRRTGMSDGSGQTAWSYDAAGRIVTERRSTAGVTKTISYTYENDGSLASVTYPSGRTVSYTIGNAERPLSAIDSADGINYATSATYAPQGAPASIVHGNVSGGFGGITESYTYNNRLEWNTAQASSSNGTVLNWVYNFVQTAGNNGSVASITNNVDTGRSESLTYDPLDRVLTAQASATSGPDCWGQGFGTGGVLADDPLANLLSESVTKCSTPTLSVSVNTNNQINTTGFGYDAAGDMTADGQFTYTFDAENRITGSSAGVNYTYDGNGLRVEKSNGTLYWRAFSGDVLAETDTSGNTTKEYIYFAGRQVAWRDASGNVYYEFADGLGSTRVVTDSTGHSCFDTDYYPYGQEMDHTATCPPTNRFTGYEYDSETSNYYAFFRYYSPRLGRFMTPDPLGGDVGSPQSLNRYSYVVNNPLKYADPLGLHDNLCVPDCVEEGGPGSYGGLGLGDGFGGLGGALGAGFGGLLGGLGDVGGSDNPEEIPFNLCGTVPGTDQPIFCIQISANLPGIGVGGPVVGSVAAAATAAAASSSGGSGGFLNCVKRLSNETSLAAAAGNGKVANLFLSNPAGDVIQGIQNLTSANLGGAASQVGTIVEGATASAGAKAAAGSLPTLVKTTTTVTRTTFTTPWSEVSWLEISLTVRRIPLGAIAKGAVGAAQTAVNVYNAFSTVLSAGACLANPNAH